MSNRLSIRAFEYSPQRPTHVATLPECAGFILLVPLATGPGRQAYPYGRVASVLSRRKVSLTYVPSGTGMLVVDIANGVEPPTNEQLTEWLNEHSRQFPGGPSLPPPPIVVKPE